MADIELVVKIPKEMYKWVNDVNKCFDDYGTSDFIDLIKNGISLPKGHGRIGDLDALEQEMVNGIKASNFEDGYDDYPHINNVDDCVECVRYAETIIEADKAESEG